MIVPVLGAKISKAAAISLQVSREDDAMSMAVSAIDETGTLLPYSSSARLIRIVS